MTQKELIKHAIEVLSKLQSDILLEKINIIFVDYSSDTSGIDTFDQRREETISITYDSFN